MGRYSQLQKLIKSRRINGPYVLVGAHNPKVVSSVLPPATLIVERVDIAGHRFGLDGRVVVVGEVNSNQMLPYDFSILL